MAQSFERLQGLGEERFDKVMNALLRGQPAMALAREIQQTWGEFQDVQEKTLTQQLNRLRQAMAEGLYGKRVAKSIAAGNTPHVKMLERVSVKVLDRMEDLAEIQKGRVLALVEKEKNMPVPVGAMLQATNAVFNDYRQVLLDLQKIRFDLGLDEFRGPMNSVVTSMRGASQSVAFPDGTNVQKQVFEAVTTVEKIFNDRKIQLPPLTDNAL